MAVIFDFDGVLADSFSRLASLNSEAMSRIGGALSAQGYRELFRGNIHDSLRRLAGSDSRWRSLRAYKRRRFASVYGKVPLFPFAPRLIRSLAGRHRLGIVSSTETRHIRRALKSRGLTPFFSAVQGSSAHSKRSELRACVRALGSGARDTFFITDTTGDVRVGRALRLRTLGVAWGFHPESWLRAARPEKVFRGPESLARYCLSRGAHGV